MRPITLISGGQTGADRGGLEAGKQLGIRTGGWMPLGWKAEDGYHPEFKDEYNLSTTRTSDYMARAAKNIADSHLTVVFSTKPQSAGTKATLRECRIQRKPRVLLDPFDSSAESTLLWIAKSRLDAPVWNIAGNRESVSPGIQSQVRKLLVKVLG